MTTELDELKAQNAKLTERIAKLEEAAKPPEPFVPGPRFQFDPTANASMPANAMKAMIDAVPDTLMRDLRADARKPNPVTQASSSPIRSTPSAQPQWRNTGGWRDEVPLGPQPGIEHVDRLVDAQDQIDKAELALKFAKARMGKGETK